MLTKPDKIKLFTLMGNYPNAMALKEGKLASGIVEFDFAEVNIVTFLQARTYGKPYALIPATVVGRGQLHTIAYNPERGELKASDLNGKTLGVRAFTQTTGVWVRGSLKWVTFEEGHVAEYADPPNVRRAPEGKQLVQMLLDGEIAAAIVGDKFPDPRLKPLIPEPEAANRQWSESHGGVPINHMLVIREALAKSRPDVVREVYRLFLQAKRQEFGRSGVP